MKIVVSPGRRNARYVRGGAIQFVRAYPSGWPLWRRLIPYISAAALWIYLWSDRFAG